LSQRSGELTVKTNVTAAVLCYSSFLVAVTKLLRTNLLVIDKKLCKYHMQQSRQLITK